VDPAFLHWIAAYGAVAIFVLLLLGVFGLPIPDETILTFAGVLVREGRLSLVPTVVAAVLGAVGGVSLSYIVGRRFGLEVVVRYGRWLHVRPAHLDRAQEWFEHSGRWLLVFGYFIPGVRHLTALIAGSARLPVAVFARYAYSGAAGWAIGFVALGWYVGTKWEGALAAIHGHLWLLLGILAAAATGYLVIVRMRRRT